MGRLARLGPRRDIGPDGAVSGPYASRQVIGLALTLPPPVYWATARRRPVSAVLGTSAGLTAAACYDSSDDSSGLFVIGAALVLAGSPAATTAVCGIIGFARRAAVTG